jgi:hypothetical protein
MGHWHYLSRGTREQQYTAVEACAVCCMYPSFSVDSGMLVSDCPSTAVAFYSGLGYGVSVEQGRSGRCHISPRKAPVIFLMAM